MVKTARGTNKLDAIQAERSRLEERLLQLAEEEKAAREAQADAGREAFLEALGKVKIPGMTRSQARQLARLVSDRGAEAVLEKFVE